MKKNHLRALFIGFLLALTAFSGNVFASHSKKTAGAETAQAEWFSGQQVAAILQPGVVWCFEPEAATCLFTAVSNGAIASETSNWFSYDVLELWDETTVLSVPTLGELRQDGSLCETIDLAFEGLSVTGLDGSPVSKIRFSEVKNELVEGWRPDEGREFCFKYIREDPGQSDLISQYVITDGVPDGEPLRFVLSSDAPAVANFELRF